KPTAAIERVSAAGSHKNNSMTPVIPHPPCPDTNKPLQKENIFKRTFVMAPPHHPNSNKPPFIFNPAGTEKHARFEDVPDEDMPSGRRKNIFGELPQPQRKAQHSHPSGEGHR